MQSYRPTTMATNGMVTSPHYLASQAGMKILQQGGNAVEAAIAIASTLGVVYPHMNGIGGDNFWLIHHSEANELKGLNASGKSAQAATIDYYEAKGYESIPNRGYHSANTVPGAISGWSEAYEYSKKEMAGELSWEAVLADAIHYAEKGFPVTPSQEYWTNMFSERQLADKEEQFQEFRNIFLKADGTAYRTGETFQQKDLAKTLAQISAEGGTSFYHGEIAAKVAADMKANGGLLELEDFHLHAAEWVDPISVNYRDCQAYNLPPNTQGMASLSILNILNNFDFNQIKEGSTDYYHLIVEATKRAFKDRDEWLTDPEFVNIPLDDLLSEQRGKAFADQIMAGKMDKQEALLDPKGDTVWLGVVDQWGNAVSLIQSIYHEFGAGIIPKGTGILMQNRGSFFSLDEKAVNRLMPGKRTFHTLNPAMLFKQGKPYLVYGTMGGEGQPQTQAALVTKIVDYGFDIQAAIEAPRWLFGRTWGAPSNTLKLENRIPDKVIEELQRRNHLVEKVPAFTDMMGHAGAILINSDTNTKFGGADPRGDGAALGY